MPLSMRGWRREVSSMNRRNWKCPHDWLAEKSAEEEDPVKLRTFIRELAGKLDCDSIQDLFQGEMDEDGYFEPKDRKAMISRGGTTPWVDIDREYGDREVLPWIVILDEGFDGLRIAVGTEYAHEVAEVIFSEADLDDRDRFERCDEDGLFHFWGRALEVADA